MEEPTEQDLLKTVWVFPEFLQAVGPLHEGNVMEYFSHSPFFDRQSTNQQLKMQTVHTGAEGLNEAEELRRFTGIEFALVHARAPALFIIHKRERFSPDDTATLASYSIINNNCYLSPTLDNILSSRLNTAVDALHSSLSTLRDRLGEEASFDPRGETQVVLTRQPVMSAAKLPETSGSTTDASSSEASKMLPSLIALRSALAGLPALNAASTTAPPPPPDLNPRILHNLTSSRAGSTPRTLGNTPTPGGPGTNRSGMVPTPPATNKSTGTPATTGGGAGGGGGGGKKKKRKVDSVDLSKGGGKNDNSPFTRTPIV